MADLMEDSSFWSPIEMLIDAYKTSKDKYKHIKKAIVIFYDEEQKDNKKRIRWSQAGMRRSEILNLLSLSHDSIILDMFDDIT